jgi:hypothetical protein
MELQQRSHRNCSKGLPSRSMPANPNQADLTKLQTLEKVAKQDNHPEESTPQPELSPLL